MLKSRVKLDILKNYAFNDFFVGMSAEYNRNWDETAFTIKGKYKNVE